MKTYVITIREVHTVTLRIPAESSEEAIHEANSVLESDDALSSEYSYTLGPDEWDITEEN